MLGWLVCMYMRVYVSLFIRGVTIYNIEVDFCLVSSILFKLLFINYCHWNFFIQQDTEVYEYMYIYGNRDR